MKTIVLICLFAFNVFSCLYTQVVQEWVTRYNGPSNGYDDAFYVAIDGIGNIYVTGFSAGNGSQDDYATIKYNSTGIQQWASRYNGLGNGIDWPRSIAVDNIGNVYVTGYSDGSGTGRDYATIKYNSSGVQQWVQRYNGPGNGDDWGNSVSFDVSGNVYVTGWSTGNGTNQDFATIKYNSSGVQQWVTRYNGPGNGWDEAFKLIVDGSGNVFVTGWSPGIGSGLDYATIKYNSTGVEQWVSRYNGPGNDADASYSLAVDGSGNVFITGQSLGSGTNQDYATIEYNSSGVQQWIARYNGPGNGEDDAYSLKLDGSGNVYVSGTSYGNITGKDYATIKYNSSGIQQWVSRYNGPGNDEDVAYSLAVDGLGNAYVTGWSTGSGTYFDFATIKYNSSGIQQWVSRFNGTGNSDDYARSIAVDNSGTVYVTGTSSEATTGNDYTTIKYSPQQLIVNQPSGYVKWIAGETDTIKWSGSPWISVNVKCTLNVGTSQQSEISIAQNASNSNQLFIWNIPDTLLSFRTKIAIENSNNTTEKIESAIFRVKPYLLTRFDINGFDTIYYAFKKDRDQWGFRNDSSQLWPYQWYQQFNYRGTDPFTGLQYSQWQGNGIFNVAKSIDHPDWVSFVNTFTLSDCYWSSILGIYKIKALERWKGLKRPFWRGSCFGIATANAIVFRNKNEFLAKYTLFPQFSNPINVTATFPVVKTVNELLVHEFGQPHQSYGDYIYSHRTPCQTLNELKSMLISDTNSICVLAICNNQKNSGGHAINPYKIVKNSNTSQYFVYVYDNQYPDSTHPIVIDTAMYSGDGYWSYHEFPTWGLNKGIFLMDPALSYLSNPTFDNESKSKSKFLMNDSLLQIYNSNNLSIIIKDSFGNITGYKNDSLYRNIPNSYPIIIADGHETPPYGYDLSLNNYKIELSNFLEDTISVSFFNRNKTFSYRRKGASPFQTDRLIFDGNITVTNHDLQNKTINLLNIISEANLEKLFVLDSLRLTIDDSLKLLNLDSNTIKLISFSSEKNYNVELNFVNANVIWRFGAFDISLPANSSHTFVPQWQNLQNSQLMVLVDLGNNGTIDDTLWLNNQIIGINNEGNSLPTKYNLAQNYPNPFNPISTISYDIVQKVKTTLTIFNVLGQEIVKLVDEVKGPGKYRVVWDATNYPSGVYFYKLKAGDFVDSKKMILLK